MQGQTNGQRKKEKKEKEKKREKRVCKDKQTVMRCVHYQVSFKRKQKGKKKKKRPDVGVAKETELLVLLLLQPRHELARRRSHRGEHLFGRGRRPPARHELGDIAGADRHRLGLGLHHLGDAQPLENRQHVLAAFGPLVAGKGLGRQQAAFDAFEQHEDRLAEQLLGYLRGKAGVRIIGLDSAATGGRVPTVSFTVAGLMPETVVRHLDRFNSFAWG